MSEQSVDKGKGERNKWLKRLGLALIIVILGTIFLPKLDYHFNITGDRSQDLRESIDFISEEIRRAEEKCGGLGPTFNEALKRAKTHRGNAEDALLITKDFGKAESEVVMAQQVLREARDMGCPDIIVPQVPTEQGF